MKKKKEEFIVQKISSIREMTELAVTQSPDEIAYRFKENGGVRDVTYREFYDTKQRAK